MSSKHGQLAELVPLRSGVKYMDGSIAQGFCLAWVEAQQKQGLERMICWSLRAPRSDK